MAKKHFHNVLFTSGPGHVIPLWSRPQGQGQVAKGPDGDFSMNIFELDKKSEIA